MNNNNDNNNAEGGGIAMVSDNEDAAAESPEQAPSNAAAAAAADTAGLNIQAVAETVGGTATQPCFCLLDGVLLASSGGEIDRTQQAKRVTLPIKRLPAILGRTHKTTDPHVVCMGISNKALSRQQCRIDYWCHRAGRLEQKSMSNKASKKKGAASAEDDDEEFVYKRNIDNAAADTTKLNVMNPEKHDLTNGKPFYTITCLGKNRIVVNGKRVDPGQTCVLHDGASVRISTVFWLYFLLPVPKSTRKMEITLPNTSTTAKPTLKPSLAAAANKKRPKLAGSASDNEPAAKKGRTMPIQVELDGLDTDELRRQLTEAIDNDIWDRRHQLVGSTISYRAVLTAARQPDLQARCQQNGGLSRGEIMTWIATGEFSEWSEQMQSKLETKSYQLSITKAMLKAGFTRTASAGRYVKWMIPAHLYNETATATATTTAESSKKSASKPTTLKKAAAKPAAEPQQEQRMDTDDDDDDDSNNPEEGPSGDEEQEEAAETKEPTSGVGPVDPYLAADDDDDDEEDNNEAAEEEVPSPSAIQQQQQQQQQDNGGGDDDDNDDDEEALDDEDDDPADETLRDESEGGARIQQHVSTAQAPAAAEEPMMEEDDDSEEDAAAAGSSLGHEENLQHPEHEQHNMNDEEEEEEESAASYHSAVENDVAAAGTMKDAQHQQAEEGDSEAALSHADEEDV